MKFLNKLKIANYKSIDSLELNDLSPFTVFAGANGSGKSNFFDALIFMRLFVQGGIEFALRTCGGYDHIHSAKRIGKKARRFEFEIEYDLSDDSNLHYVAVIDDLDDEPKIQEQIQKHIHAQNKILLERKKGKPPVITVGERKEMDQFPSTHSALLLENSPSEIANMLKYLHIYRIDPISAKQPDQSSSNPTVLEPSGYNLASVLNRLGKDKKARTTILEWMEMIVPGLEGIDTAQQRLDSKTAILFKEKGASRKFPAHLVSDGTMYALCMLVAIFDSKNHRGLTLIEEPERGLHPKAIEDLTGLMRECATPSHPIWLTTHSEAVIRSLKLAELFLVSKKDGRTEMQPATSGNLTDEDIKPLGLDHAWLSNLLGSGSPW